MKKFAIVAIGVFLAGIVGILLFAGQATGKDIKTANENRILPVSVVAVARQKLPESRSLTGTIAANNDVVVVSETMGRVLAVMAEVGESKPAGAVVAKIDDELKLANFNAAEVNFLKAKKDLQRFENLYAQKAVTDMEIESARLALKAAEAQYVVARRQYTDTQIRVPISGIVTARFVNIGATVQPGSPIVNIVDIGKLKVLVNVAERDAFRIMPGDKVAIGTDVYPGVVFPGSVKSVSSKGDEGHTYPLEITLANSREHPLKAGMFARISFPPRENSSVLVIPRESLLGSVKNAQVFVVERGIARLRTIVVGSDAGTQIEVLSGLNEKEMVVISGQNNLRDNTPVTVLR